MRSSWKETYLASPAFYRSAMALVIPMILQAGITNFVSLLDNIMVGQIGTMQMSGVSIVNQYVFIFNLTLFGAVSGPGIFGAQYFGKGDSKGQRDTFRFRVLICGLIALGGCVIFAVCKTPLISLFLNADDSAQVIAQTLGYGIDYMALILFSLIPFAIGQAYASVLRESGHTRIPMIASIAALVINLALDYILIFGKCGFPVLGVKGAAIATVIAKIVEAIMMIVWAHRNPEKNPYIIGLYRHFHIPKPLMIDMMKKTWPLMVNEFLWSAAMAVIAQSFSIRGLDVVAARNIAGTLNNLFSVVFVQLGAGLGIIVGRVLGTGRHEEARSTNTKLTFFVMIISSIAGLCMLPLAKAFPMLYNTEETVRSLATFMIIVQALATPMWSYTNAAYFTIRSGGKTGITFLFDFIFTWVIMVPVALILAYLTPMDIHPMYVIVIFSEMVKVFAGYVLVKRGKWLQTIVG